MGSSSACHDTEYGNVDYYSLTNTWKNIYWNLKHVNGRHTLRRGFGKTCFVKRLGCYVFFFYNNIGRGNDLNLALLLKGEEFIYGSLEIRELWGGQIWDN